MKPVVIKLIVGGKDVSEVVEKATWAGDVKQVSRTLNFTIAQKSTDKHLPKVVIDAGDKVQLSIDGVAIFIGVVFDIDRAATSNVLTYLAYDLMFYVNKSEISAIYNATPESITSQVCGTLGVPFGYAAGTGMSLYLPVLQKTGYEAIMMAYTAASRANGKKYIPLIQNDTQVCVIEKGLPCGVTLDGDYNLIDANYKTTLQELVNKILLVDKNGNMVSTAEDGGSQSKYGTIQKIVKQDEDDKGLTSDLTSKFIDLVNSASVTAISDIRARAGYSLQIYEPITGLCGVFCIDSDTHTYTGGHGQMQLTLAFKNMMDEKEMDKQSDNGGGTDAEQMGY